MVHDKFTFIPKCPFSNPSLLVLDILDFTVISLVKCSDIFSEVSLKSPGFPMANDRKVF